MAIVIYCGTQHGIVTVREQGDGQWAVGERRFLPDWDVAELAVDSQGRLIAATRGDGVWFQTDPSGAGRTGGWVKPNYGQPGPGKVHCLAVDPQDPDTIYAGGEPIGIWVTHDRGKHWESLDGVRRIPGMSEITYPVPSVEPHVRDIVIDPTDRNVLYAAFQVGYMAKSTDRGKTWHLQSEGIDADVHTIIVRPAEPQHLYAATGGHGHRQGVTKGKALYASRDGGNSWSPMAEDLPQDYAVPMAMHPTDADFLVSAVANGPPPEWRRPSGAEARLIVSRDGGKSWRVADGAPREIGAEFPRAISFDPADPDSLYICTDRGKLFRSRNGGGDWTPIPVDLSKAGFIAERSNMEIFHS